MLLANGTFWVFSEWFHCIDLAITLDGLRTASTQTASYIFKSLIFPNYNTYINNADWKSNQLRHNLWIDSSKFCNKRCDEQCIVVSATSKICQYIHFSENFAFAWRGVVFQWSIFFTSSMQRERVNQLISEMNCATGRINDLLQWSKSLLNGHFMSLSRV